MRYGNGPEYTASYEDVSELFDEMIEVTGNAVHPLHGMDPSVFSRSDLDSMDEVIAEFGAISASNLSNLSYGENAWNKAEMNRKIDFELLFDGTPEGQQMLKLLQEEFADVPAIPHRRIRHKPCGRALDLCFAAEGDH